MKIIKVDNFDRDYISDQLIAENITNDFYAEFIVTQLNNEFSKTHSPDFFRLVDDDYKLYEVKLP